jgi:hypothetical protein
MPCLILVVESLQPLADVRVAQQGITALVRNPATNVTYGDLWTI